MPASKAIMTKRIFPEIFEGMRAFLAYEQNSDGGFTLWGFEGQDWVKDKRWKDRPKHTLAELRIALDAKSNWHLAFFPEGTAYAVLDFDFKKFDALTNTLSDEERVRLGPRINASRALMDEWLAELKAYTYVAISKSGNGYHAIIEYPYDGRRIETGEGDPLDLLGAGFIVLTGWSCGHIEIARPWPDHATSIQHHWPDDGREAAGLGEVWFGDKKLTLHERPLEEAESIGIDELRERLLRLNPRYAWHLDGAGDAYRPSPDQRRHQPRMDLLQGLALVTYGMPEASELIWEVVRTSWFANSYTPAASNSNKDRFESRSKVRWIKQREIPIAIALAHQQKLKEKQQIQQAKAASKAMILAREEQAPMRPSVLPDSRCDLLNRYADYLGRAQMESEAGMNKLAAIVHASAACSRNFVTTDKVTTNLYVLAAAKQGAGKGVFSFNEWLLQSSPQAYMNRCLQMPASYQAFYKGVARRPNGLLVIAEVGDKFLEWLRPNDRNNQTFRELKDLFTAKQGAPYIGREYSDETKTVQPIHSPAPSFVGEGTHKQTYNALRQIGTEDGFVGRFCFFEGGDDHIDNYETDDILPDDLKRAFEMLLMLDPNPTLAPNPIIVPRISDTLHRSFMDEARAQKRIDDEMSPFWRSASIQAQKLALTLAVFKAVERGYVPLAGKKPDFVIADEEYAWAVEMVRLSIATAEYQVREQGAYSHDEARLGGELRRVLRRYSGGLKLGPQAAKAREEGYFTAGGLGPWGAEFSRYPNGETKAKATALRFLLMREEIVVIGTKQILGDVFAGVRFGFGPNWGNGSAA